MNCLRPSYEFVRILFFVAKDFNRKGPAGSPQRVLRLNWRELLFEKAKQVKMTPICE